MKKIQFTFGALTTLSVDAILFLSAIGEEVLTHSFVISVLIIFAFVSFIKLMLGNATKDNEGTDWKSIGSFVLGSAISTIIVLVMGLATIV